ncbi:response regulator transcription factor [Pseudomonas sp. KCJK8927]|uniref:response regulator transcription factor n=1 Tax=Pseudomonas sp. KCJK8927 TaxID=3344560 RepID=UPI0039061148
MNADVSPLESMVYVVDDDPSMRDALTNLLRSVGMRVETFSSTLGFLSYKRIDAPSCLVLDVRLQGSSGLDFQRELSLTNFRIPIIFITGHGDIEMSVKAMKAGAVDFLSKPFRDQDLLDAVAAAIRKDVQLREAERSTRQLHLKYEKLTVREREVMHLAAQGLMNKQIAAHLNLSEITVKIHRANAMKKMEARSFADLVRMAESLNLGP